MNCYLCFLETGQLTRGSLGICHLCGAGCCEHHLVSITSRPVVGMAGMIPKTHQLRCSLCHKDALSGLQSSSTTCTSKEHLCRENNHWWKWFIRQKPHVLPSAEEAVALVERFLKHNQKQQERD